MSFPLLRTPHVVFWNIANQIAIRDIINLSFCSNRMYNLVKTYRKKPKDSGIEVMYDDNPAVTMTDFLVPRLIGVKNISSVGRIEGKKFVIKIGGHQVTAVINEYIRTFWDDEKVGMRVIMEYMIDLFESKLDSIRVHNTGWEWLIDWINKLPEPIEQTSVMGSVDGDGLRHLLENNNSKQLYLFGPLSNGPFVYTGTFRESDLFIAGDRNAQWITIDNLLSLNCETIGISQKFSCSELNRFLKHWLAGGSPRLRYISANTHGLIDELTVFDECQPRQSTEGRKFENRYRCITLHGIEITRNDGAIAVIVLQHERFIIGVFMP